jgi:RNA polymerase sigma-70 factor, ECF subfamily
VTQDTLHLAELAARGDENALAELLTRHLPAVRAFVRAHMGPQLRARESMSDIVQSVCRELLTHRQRFQHAHEHAFAAWLFTTARRKIGKRARDLGRDKRAAGREVAGLTESRMAELGPAYARISSPTGAALRREAIAGLERALDQMPADQREVLTLAHLAGLSRAEIGKQTGRTDEAVRAMLHRAKARLAMLMLPAQGAPAPLTNPGSRGPGRGSSSG